MIDFTKSIEARKRQDSITVNEVEYKIQTSFHWWILFGRMIIKNGYTYEDFDKFYTITVPDDRVKGFKELLKFFKNEQPLPHDLGEKTDIIGVDWKIDSEYIWAAFIEKYNKDLLTEDISWHSFLALFHALKDTAINDIMSVRLYTDKKSKKDPMKKLKEMWELAPKPRVSRKKREE